MVWLIITFGCIQEVDILPDDSVSILVIEGFLSTQEGPHEIVISRSAPYGDIFTGAISFVNNAQVFLRDEVGNTTQLEIVQERLPAWRTIGPPPGVTLFDGFSSSFRGRYQTPPAFLAEVGKTYTLHIIIQDDHYISFPQTILPVPSVDSISYEVREPLSAAPLDTDAYGGSLDLFVHFKDPSEVKNNYLWLNNGIFSIRSNLTGFDERTGQASGPGPCFDQCWMTESGDRSIRILSDVLINGTTATALAASIPNDGWRFSTEYYADILQLSISPEAFDYFSLVKNQLGIGGSIFDPPPATIRGNFTCINDPERQVVGFFFAADVAKSRINITRQGINLVSRNYNGDCRDFIRDRLGNPENLYTVPPPFMDPSNEIEYFQSPKSCF